MVKERIIGCIRKVWPVALKTSCWFLKIMLPVSFVVMLLTYFQVLPAVSAVVCDRYFYQYLYGDRFAVEYGFHGERRDFVGYDVPDFP